MPYDKGRPIEENRDQRTGRETGRYQMIKWLGTVCYAALLVLAVGCSAGEADVDTNRGAPLAGTDSPIVLEQPDEKTSLQDVPPSKESSEAIDAEDPKEKNNISVASPQTETIEPASADDMFMNEDDREQMKTAEEARQEFNRRNYDVTGTFDPLHPTLMGIPIGLAVKTVEQRFGEPSDTFVLPDDSKEAVVRSYPGFLVGIRDNKVLFVEVSTRSVNPGLNGLRLGDPREEVYEKLGQPTTDSDFVISYQAGGSVLKLDLDPETQRIHSMKLFPEE